MLALILTVIGPAENKAQQVDVQLASAAAGEQKRLALVIGNSDYQVAPDLKNPYNDASAIAAVLEKLNFEVSLGLDLDAASLRKQIQKFVGRLGENTVAIFFYAGHGMQVNGTNYMVPVDANLGSISDLEFEAVRFDLLMGPMQQSAGTSIVFLDACRDNPLADNLARSMKTRSLMGQGLAPIQSGAGLFIGFATQPDNVAGDGTGANSPFTTALLRYLPVPDLDVEMMMRKVRDEVMAATDRKQVPWSNSSLSSAGFTFNPTHGAQSPQVSPAAPIALEPSNGQIELEFWRSIANSNDPQLFESYLRRYPDGMFRDIAASKAKELGKPTSRASLDRSEGGSGLSPKKPAKPVSSSKTTTRNAASVVKKSACRMETREECRARAFAAGKARPGYCRDHRIQICN